ncbi:MAG: hypothetical protein QM644_21715 [Mobilitalea sp.]
MDVNNNCFGRLSKHAPVLDTTFPHGVIRLNRVDKVKVAATALRTDNPEAIADMTGLGLQEVVWVLGCLEDANWDAARAMELDSDNQSINHTLNVETYSILRNGGTV